MPDSPCFCGRSHPIGSCEAHKRELTPEENARAQDFFTRKITPLLEQLVRVHKEMVKNKETGASYAVKRVANDEYHGIIQTVQDLISEGYQKDLGITEDKAIYRFLSRLIDKWFVDTGYPNQW